jgi:hypothetical protein
LESLLPESPREKTGGQEREKGLQSIDRIDRILTNPAACGVFPQSMPLLVVDRQPGFVDRAAPICCPGLSFRFNYSCFLGNSL